ncbi:hypothetical protein J2X83_005820 [Brevibacillus nitrificans]|nr:hypothetical protein [Brevibacillus nitrificans]
MIRESSEAIQCHQVQHAARNRYCPNSEIWQTGRDRHTGGSEAADFRALLHRSCRPCTSIGWDRSWTSPGDRRILF